MLSRLLLVCVACVAIVLGQECNNPQPSRGIAYYFQDGDCSVETPYCTFGGASETQQKCTRCRIGDSGVYGTVGTCNCDPRTHYCSQGGTNAGSCRPYTKLNDPCGSNLNCRTTVNVITAIYPVVQTEQKLDESLACVDGRCKPCDPQIWRDNIGQPGVATVTCGGYNQPLSDTLDRYAAESAMPGFTYTCNTAGNIQVLDDQVDYNFDYPGGNRTQWTPTPEASPPPGTSSETSTSSATSATSADATSSSGWSLVPTIIVVGTLAAAAL